MPEERKRFDEIPLGTTDDHNRFFALSFMDIACGMLTAAIESDGQTLEEWMASSGNADTWKRRPRHLLWLRIGDGACAGRSASRVVHAGGKASSSWRWPAAHDGLEFITELDH